MTDSVLRMWTVYDHPTDYPDSYVARLFEVDETGELRATPSTVITPNLEMMRYIMCFEFHLACLTRNQIDDPKIVEVWL